MSDILTMLQSPAWWFSSIIIGIAVNIISYFIVTYFPRLNVRWMVYLALVGTGGVWSYSELAFANQWSNLSLVSKVGAVLFPLIPIGIYYVRRDGFEIIVYLLAMASVLTANESYFTQDNFQNLSTLAISFSGALPTAVLVLLVTIGIRDQFWRTVARNGASLRE